MALKSKPPLAFSASERLTLPPINKLARIAVVDDDEAVARITSRILTVPGRQIDVFYDPKEAFEAFRKEPYDLVITDYHMPGMTGGQLIEEIKKGAPDTKFIVLSGAATPEDRAAFIALGAKVFPKPFDLTELRQAVVDALASLDLA